MPIRIEKTQAIVLRYVPHGNTSRIVTWLTPDHGRIGTMIKGALRPKSPFLGQYDLFYTCELLYYLHHRSELHLAKECCPLKIRPALRQHWPATALASYLTDLAARVSPAQAPQSFLFHWLNSALDALAEAKGPLLNLMIWHELALLSRLGLAPRLTTCIECHAPLRADRAAARFSHQRGGLLCASCAQRDGQPALPIPPSALAILRNWQQAPTLETAQRTRCQPGQMAVVERITGEFLRYHVDLPLPSRDIALAITKRAS